ncbi:MAG: alanyl-tRNA editing protein [Acidimicrobiia bacterium]|nr:alanyl-tRNA editing protein [Acidimicrobiia bacterium]
MREFRHFPGRLTQGTGNQFDFYPLRYAASPAEGANVTEEIASVDAYHRSIDAVITEVLDGGVVLDRTVFYPRGGGQPGDTGVLQSPAGDIPIVDTFKKGGKLLHAFESGNPEPGTNVKAVIDWERRHTLMRTHTALHALSAIIWRDFDAKVTGGNMEPGSARMDFELDAISVDFGREVESVLNRELQKGLPVHVHFLAREAALADPDLIRTKVNLLPDFIDPIRVIEIEGLDKQADGGTHVGSTAEVGQVAVVKTESKGKANKRIRIELTADA